MTEQISHTVEIIAELAQGFEGKPLQSALLLKAAATAGANAAKFQLVYADELATPDYVYYDLFESLEMSDATWLELAGIAAKEKIELQLDIFGARSLQLAERIGVKTVKLHSTDNTNINLLEEVAASSVDRVLLGAGGAHAPELDQAAEILRGKQLVMLLGFQGYPTLDGDNQIARVRRFVDRYSRVNRNIAIGFADHAAPADPTRYAIAATAVGAGATVIEKHLTLGKVMRLEDHEAALNPDEFLEFCTTIRACAAAVGSAMDSGDFGMSTAETEYRNKIRRHVVAARNLAAGSHVSPADLTLKRSAATSPLMDLQQAYGKILRNAKAVDDPLVSGDLQ